jgi:hypothetical protein
MIYNKLKAPLTALLADRECIVENYLGVNYTECDKDLLALID